ncbi:MAG: selenium-dependent molybdenum cofactor biosynthesis protein YqeB [Acidimicrobiales bacterium]
MSVMAPELCLIRGGGDLATGVAWRLHRAGYPVIVSELERPLTVRRTVALSSAVADGLVSIEGMVGRRAESGDAKKIAHSGEVAVVVAPELLRVGAGVLVDARMAKRNIDTRIDDAPLVIGLGPGFTANHDCHVVIETMRGPRLGRALWEGSAEPNTGSPGLVDGHGSERVLRAPMDGIVEWSCEIGDPVRAGQRIGFVAGEAVRAPFDGVIRGLIRDSQPVDARMKIGDVDPRMDVTYNEISDKALAIGGGVMEAVLTWQNQSR